MELKYGGRKGNASYLTDFITPRSSLVLFGWKITSPSSSSHVSLTLKCFYKSIFWLQVLLKFTGTFLWNAPLNDQKQQKKCKAPELHNRHDADFFLNTKGEKSPPQIAIIWYLVIYNLPHDPQFSGTGNLLQTKSQIK